MKKAAFTAAFSHIISFFFLHFTHRYSIINIGDDFVEPYEIIGKKRGALSKGGIVDYEKVSTIIVNDLKNGYFNNITFDRL